MLAWVAALAASAAVASQSPRFLSARVAGGSAQDVADVSAACAEVELLWPRQIVRPQNTFIPAPLGSIQLYVAYLAADLNLSSPCDRCCVAAECPGWPAGHACRGGAAATQSALCLPAPAVIDQYTCDRHATWITCPKGVAVAVLWGGGSLVCAATYFYRRRAAKMPPPLDRKLPLGPAL